MGAACRALDFPIVSGNVSLYNESKATGGGSAILPTPAIGGVGLLDDYSAMATIGVQGGGRGDLPGRLRAVGDAAPARGHLGQSLWLREIHGREEGDAPHVDLTLEKNSGEFVRELIAAGLVSAVHDVSDGGLAVTLAEMALASGLGADVVRPRRLHARRSGGSARTRAATSSPCPTSMPSSGRSPRARAMPTPPRPACAASARSAETRLFGVPLTQLAAAHESFFRDWMEAEPAELSPRTCSGARLRFDPALAQRLKPWPGTSPG